MHKLIYIIVSAFAPLAFGGQVGGGGGLGVSSEELTLPMAEFDKVRAALHAIQKESGGSIRQVQAAEGAEGSVEQMVLRNEAGELIIIRKAPDFEKSVD